MVRGGAKRRSAAGAGVLLKLVREGQATTQLELTRLSNQSRTTVRDRLELLLEAGLLVPTGPAASTGGRRPSAFAFNHARAVVLVADFGAVAARFACCDLGGNVLAYERHAVDIGAGPEPNLALARKRLSAVLRAAGARADRVWGVAVGVPGPVEVATGRVVSPPIMTGWNGIEVGVALDLPFDSPVVVDNDVNLMALGEHRSLLRDEDHILFVKVGTGVGCGIVAAGKLHRGARGSAGDIGHIQGLGVDDVCRCGIRGCVEASAGGWAIARDLRALGRDADTTADVVELLLRRDPDAVRLIQQAAQVVGTAVADAVSFFNPSTVVLGGELPEADERLLTGVREAVHARSLPLATRSLTIRLSELGDRAGVIGGVHLAIEHTLAPEVVDRALAEGRFDGGGARRRL